MITLPCLQEWGECLYSCARRTTAGILSRALEKEAGPMCQLTDIKKVLFHCPIGVCFHVYLLIILIRFGESIVNVITSIISRV